MSFAVVVCPGCRDPWAVAAGHATASCPRCSRRVELAHRTALWSGPDAREAQRQAAHHRAQMAGTPAPGATLLPTPAARAARHDSPLEEAAAAARGIANKGSRAEMVAAALDRHGAMPHAQLVQALQLAGLPADRAEAEVTRMLAMDILMEPRAGQYRMLA